VCRYEQQQFVHEGFLSTCLAVVQAACCLLTLIEKTSGAASVDSRRVPTSGKENPAA
jgi:hypothetical protein